MGGFRFVIMSMLAALLAASGYNRLDAADSDGFVKVVDGQLMLGESAYTFVGTNFWYAPILASEGEGGDRVRLLRELDNLQKHGINNIRILAGSEHRKSDTLIIRPVMQTAPGVYNDTLLAALDYLLYEFEKREMKAVLFLTNSWEWSGGFGSYLEWSGHGDAVLPQSGWKEFTAYTTQLFNSDEAKRLIADHIVKIVGRVNSITGRPYSESPAIMAWEIANEPRAFSKEAKEEFSRWIGEIASLIKSIDPNHLVTTGSEGLYGCEVDIDLWEKIHSHPDIDYATIHIWPLNWKWVTPENMTDSLPAAIRETQAYIDIHIPVLQRIRKPLVIEEFGYPRDSMLLTPGSPTRARDAYYVYILSQLHSISAVQGINFWAWGGEAVPLAADWQKGAPFTGDPAHEPQGLYSVFSVDTTTLNTLFPVGQVGK